MSNTVLQEKYDKLKIKASEWRKKALEYQHLYEDIISEHDELQNKIINQNSSKNLELEQENSELRQQYDKLYQKYKETRKKLRDLELERQQEKLEEKLEDKLVERLSKRVIGLQQS